jgi:aspartate racemase
MKIPGIVGGIAPESTVHYYRTLISSVRDILKDGSYPRILIDSIDMKRMLDGLAAGDESGVADYLAAAVKNLAAAGADFGLMASNTPHAVFEAVRSRSPIPLLSIVETACEEAAARGLKRVGLFGTAFTMRGRFYPAVFIRRGIEIVPPGEADGDWIHETYMKEWVNGIFRPEARDRVLEIAGRLRKTSGVEAVLLAGTELPLLMGGASPDRCPFLDTMDIHVKAAVSFMLE